MADISYAPAEVNFVDVVRGDSLFATVTIDEGGTPVDVSGYTWRAQVRATADSTGSPLFSFTVGTASAATGILTLTLDAASWADPADALPLPDPAKFFWDLEGTSGSTVRTFLSGKIKLKADVSRA